MATTQLEWTEAELLATDPIVEPLIAGGVRCHGGFDDEGEYVSPRTKHRVPGIVAWQEKHTEEFGKPILDIPLETWPEHFPNVAQAEHLIKSGIREPLIATLTRIGTVEGFGANIRHLQPGDMQQHFDESIKGTAIDHLGKGLFEAHGRDEAGGEQEAGHKDMWFTARDIAFENPTANVDIEGMLQRMGFGAGNGGGGGGGGGVIPERILPDDISPNLEMIAGLMTRVLLIEIQAFHTFKWAEQWLSDSTLVAGDGEAAKLVTYIRGDETPHVGYLKTGLTEMRDRTWVGASGKKYSGEELFGRIWNRAIENSLGAGRDATRAATTNEVELWCAKKANGADILAEFHALGDEPVSAEARVAAAAPQTY